MIGPQTIHTAPNLFAHLPVVNSSPFQTPLFMGCFCGHALNTVCVFQAASAPSRKAWEFMHMCPRLYPEVVYEAWFGAVPSACRLASVIHEPENPGVAPRLEGSARSS